MGYTDDLGGQARQVAAEAGKVWRAFLAGGGDAGEAEAVTLAERAVALAEGVGDRALAGACHLDLGSMLASRHGHSGLPADLRSSEHHIARALDLLPEGHEDRPGAHATAASNALHRFQQDSLAQTLERAVEHARRAVTDAGADDPRLTGFRSNLASILAIRYTATGTDEDLDEAIALGRAVVASYEGPQRPIALGALLGSLAHVINRRSDMEALEEALALLPEVLEKAGPGSPHRIAVLGNVAAVLRAQHVLLGDEDGAALDRAVPLQRELFDALPPGHPEVAVHLTNLVELLVLRWRDLTSREDLDEAVRLMRRHADLPAGQFSSQLGATRSIVFRALADAHAEDGSPDDAARAASESIAAAQQLRVGAANHPMLAGRAAVLEVNAWLSLYSATKGEHALAAAENCFADADQTLLSDDPQRGTLFGNIAFLRLDALPADAGARELDPVIAMLRAAVAMFPVDARFSEASAQALTNLGVALLLRHEAVRDPLDLSEALALFAEIGGSEKTPWQMRLRASALAADALMIFGHPSQAAQWYERAVRLLPLTAWRGASRLGSEAMLGDFASLGRDAAAALLEAGRDPAEALGLLEAGRGVLWARTVELRGHRTDIQRRNPELAARLAALGRRLEAVDDPSVTGESIPGAASRRTDQRAKLSQEYRTLTAEAVATGNAGFLAPPSTADLLAAAVYGPVVVVNVSRYRCDAFVVTTDGVGCVPLPRLSGEDVERAAMEHLAALGALDLARRERTAAVEASAADPGLVAARREQAAHSAEARAARHSGDLLDRILRDLWDTVAGPVTDTLPPTAEATRLWWCPTGPLALLPLHAAGHHDCPGSPAVPGHRGTGGIGEARDAGESGGPGAAHPRTLLDRFTCSVTPTLLSLARAHREADAAMDASPAPPGAPGMLLVALPQTPGQDPLPEVVDERDQLRALWPEGGLTTLEGPAADRAAVAAALRRHPRAHIGCHGRQDTANPSGGGLMLYDGLLTVADIAAEQHHGDFALLSACETVAIGPSLPDEVISLGAALHMTGYRHVIGTQWSVHSPAAADAAGTVHRMLTTPGGRFDAAHAADALRHAALRLRADPTQPRHSWVPFTHTGP